MRRKVHIWVDANLLEEYRKYKPETKGLTYTALVEMIIRERLRELMGEGLTRILKDRNRGN